MVGILGKQGVCFKLSYVCSINFDVCTVVEAMSKFGVLVMGPAGAGKVCALLLPSVPFHLTSE